MRKILSSTYLKVLIAVLLFSLPIAGVLTLASNQKVEQEKVLGVEKQEPTLTPTVTPSATPTKKTVNNTIIATPTQQPIYVQPTTSVQIVQSTQPKTYAILSLSQLANLNGANSQTIQATQRAYNIFLQTQNLIYMTPQEQMNLFKPIAEAEIKKYLDTYKQQLENEANWYEQQTKNLQQQNQTSTQNSVDQQCLEKKLASINSNPYLSASAKQAQRDYAYQECQK